MKKKRTSLLLALAMCLGLCVPAFAVEHKRIEIIVESEDEILEFINSPQYDPNELYSFIMLNPYSARPLYPNCGSNAYVGGTATENISVQHIPCVEYASLEQSDLVQVMGIYAFARCSKCLFISGMPYPSTTYYIIDCVSSSPGAPSFMARDGNTFPPIR